MEEARLSGEFADWHNLLSDVWWLTGPLDVASVRHAWRNVCLRHDALRRTYASPDEAATHPEALSEVVLHSATTDADAIDKMRQSLGIPFDLYGPSFARVVVVQRSEQRHLLGIAVDHIISDQMSWLRLCRDFADLYERALAGDAGDPREGDTYRSFASQMRRNFRGDWGRERREFWRTHTAEFGTFPPPFSIRAQHPDEPAWKVVERELPVDATKTVHATARQARATPFAVVASCVLGGMRDVSGEEIVGLNFRHHGRFAPGSFQTLGLFAQAVPLHLRGPSKSRLDTVRDVFLRSVQVSEHILPLRVAGNAWSEDLMSFGRAPGVFLDVTEGNPTSSSLQFAGIPAQQVEMTFDGAAREPDTIVIAWELHETSARVTATYDEKAFATAAVTQLLQSALAYAVGTGGDA